MIKQLGFFLLLVACSSMPDRPFTRHQIELQAHQFFRQADAERNSLKFELAIRSYQEAAEKFALRGERQSVLLCQLRIALCYLKMDDNASVERMMNLAIKMNQMEMLNEDNSIQFMQARIMVKEKKINDFDEIMMKIIESEAVKSKKSENYYYYRLYFYSKKDQRLSNDDFEWLKESNDVLKSRYDDGEIVNVDCYILSQLTWIDQNILRSESKILNTIRIFEQDIIQMERPHLLLDIYKRYINYYQKFDKKDPKEYYQKLHDVQLKRLTFQ